MKPKWSVVIPAYNEEARLEKTMRTVLEYFQGRGEPFELILVDDGSRDQTCFKARGFQGAHPEVRVLRNARNRGKGASVRRGVAAARGEWILFTDADLSTPIQELENLSAALPPEGGVAIASRGLRQARIRVHQPFYREWMGKTFNWMVRGLVLPGIHDTQCGFKLFSRGTARPVFLKCTIPRFGFDVEILYLARRQGAVLAEVPVQWNHSQGSKVSPLRDAAQMFLDLFRVRLRHG